LSRYILSIMKNKNLNFGQLLKATRESRGVNQNTLALSTAIDAAVLSKIERGDRFATRKQVIMLATILEAPINLFLSTWLGEKIYKQLEDEDFGFDALKVAEKAFEYRTAKTNRSSAEMPADLKTRLNHIDELKQRWLSNKPLNITQLRKLDEFFKINYTFESNRIEGNTLTMQETHLVVNEGITIGGKSMREHLEAINHAEAIDFVKDIVLRKVDFNERMLKEVHHLILKGIDRDNAGRYRNVPVRIGGSEFVPAQPYLVPKLMEDVFVFFEENKKTLHPVVLAAEMHERIVTIHPFIDGNGRTSRLIMNLILLSNGYTIANLKGDYDSRMRYYSALQKAQVGNDKSEFINLIAERTHHSIQEHINMC